MNSLRLAAVVEPEDARVLEEASDDRPHRDPLAHAGHARPQAADAADDQVDPHAGLRAAIEAPDHLGSVSALTLMMMRAGRPAAACAVSRSMSSRAGAAGSTGATSSSRYSVLVRVAGQVVEQFGDVLDDRRPRGEQRRCPCRARAVAAL